MTPEEVDIVVVVQAIMDQVKILMILFLYLEELTNNISTRERTSYHLTTKVPSQLTHLHELVGLSDFTCVNNLRMCRDTFSRLVFLVENVGGLRPTRHVSVVEQLAMFLSILSHHKKNVVLQTDFKRSGYTVSKYFNQVLGCILKLHTLLFVTPAPVPEHSTDSRWKYFQGCLGALDGTYIQARVPLADKPRYRNRKGDVSFNVLAACDRNMNFVYLLTGWEGSAADSRVLRDAITRPNGFKVPTGSYYLVDSGYTNGEGFLAPYRGVRYHLHDYGQGPLAPQNSREYFNMKHAKARNVIERAFGILKSRWAILRSPSYYPVKQQNRIVMACCLLHNFIRTHVDIDPEEANVPQFVPHEDINDNNDDYIDVVEASQAWTDWRDNLALGMYNQWIMPH